jgi:hypothetical protein
MKDEIKDEAKPSVSCNASSTTSNDNKHSDGLFRKLPTLMDNNSRNSGADKSASNNTTSLDIASEKKEEKQEENGSCRSSSHDDKQSSNNHLPAAAASTTTSSSSSFIRRHNSVLCYQVHLEFPIPQKMWSSSSARQVNMSSHLRQRQLRQCNSWMIQTASRAIWRYLLYARGILPVAVHEILRAHDQVDVARKSNNNKIKNRKLRKTREALQQLDQDWNRLTSFMHSNHHQLEIVQVMIALGSSWRRPKEVHLLDFDFDWSSDAHLGNASSRTNEATGQDENDGTVAILESLQHGLSSRLLRSAMQAEGEAMINHGTNAPTIGPADQMTIFISVTATSYNDMYQQAQQEEQQEQLQHQQQQQQQQQQPWEEGLVLSSASTLLQSLTLCRDFALHNRAFGDPPHTATTVTGRTQRPLLPSLNRCSKTFLKLSPVGPAEEQSSRNTATSTAVAAASTTSDDDLSRQEQAGAGRNDNVVWLSLASTVKGFSLAE